MFNNFTPAMLDLFVSSLWETLIMVGISGLVGGLLGVPLGVFLRLTDDGGVLENGPINKLVGWLVNAVRSTPFIILLVAIIPFTRLITGSSIGTAAAVVPLTIAAAPFVARLVEAALREVDQGLVEAAQAGDREAFGELAVRFEPMVYSTALRRLGNHSEAQELCQEVLVKAMQKIDQLKVPAAFAGLFRGENFGKLLVRVAE